MRTLIDKATQVAQDWLDGPGGDMRGRRRERLLRVQSQSPLSVCASPFLPMPPPECILYPFSEPVKHFSHHGRQV